MYSILEIGDNMKKEGFSLVELLAVIAIMAIFVLIAMPNVMEMYNQAKKQSFLNEAKVLFKEAVVVYVAEKKKGNKLSEFNSNDPYDSYLTESNLKYCVELDSKGRVTSLKVSNGSYYIEGDGKFLSADVSMVREGTYEDLSCLIE